MLIIPPSHRFEIIARKLHDTEDLLTLYTILEAFFGARGLLSSWASVRWELYPEI